jgi:L-arabonate dehydrase
MHVRDKKKPKLRSAAWFGTQDKNGFMYRSWMKNQGIPDHEFQGKPVIGICNTWSELTPCNAHFRKLAEHVKRGHPGSGRLPGRVPGVLQRRIEPAPDRDVDPQPGQHGRRGIDPRQSDGRRRAAGRLRQDHAGAADGRGQRRRAGHRRQRRPDAERQAERQDIGSGTAVWQLHEQVKAGTITLHEFMSAESGMSRSAGTCNTMGTASTMACMAESLGTSLPHNAAIPAVDARRYVLAHMSGIRIVEMVQEDLKLSKLLTREAFENAIRVNAAIGGSTNAVIHLKAIAGRIGVTLELEDWTAIGKRHADHRRPAALGPLPDGRVLLRRRPAGRAPPPGRRRPAAAQGRAHRQRQEPVGELRGRADLQRRSDPPLDKPLIEGRRHLHPARQPGAARRRAQAVGRHAAPDAAPRPAVVFENFDDYKARIADPELDVDANSVLVLKNCGPKGLSRHGRSRQHGPAAQAAGAGRDRHGAHLGRAHERHRLRHRGAARGAGSDGRRPAGGAGRRLDRARLPRPAACTWTCRTRRWRNAWPPGRPAQQPTRRRSGYQKLYVEHVLQADQGCDFDFLVGSRGSAVPRHSH